jgi:hypothetical protein
MLAAALALAGCDDGGSGSEAEAEWPERAPQREDNVRAAAATIWPEGDLGSEAPRGGTLPTRPNFVAVLDMSGSMAEGFCAGDYHSRADAARAALATWLFTVPEDANLGLVVFAENRASVSVPLGSDNRQDFIRAVETIQPSGNTPLKDAVALAQGMLEEQAGRQRGYGEYRIVVITDGQHSDGQDPAPVIESIFANYANPIELHTIGFCIDRSALNRPGVTYYRSANDPEELSRGLESAVAEAEVFDITEFDPDGAGDGQ